MFKRGCRLYCASWVRDIGPDIRPEYYRKKAEAEAALNGGKEKAKEEELSTLEDLGKEYRLWFLGVCSSLT